MYDTIVWKAIEYILNEVSFPKKFTNSIMVDVTSISCRFNVNENYTSIMEAQRGLNS